MSIDLAPLLQVVGGGLAAVGGGYLQHIWQTRETRRQHAAQRADERADRREAFEIEQLERLERATHQLAKASRTASLEADGRATIVAGGFFPESEFPELDDARLTFRTECARTLSREIRDLAENYQAAAFDLVHAGGDGEDPEHTFARVRSNDMREYGLLTAIAGRLAVIYEAEA